MSGKSQEDIGEAVLKLFGEQGITAIQQTVDVIQVTFSSEEAALDALKDRGCRLFGIWCKMDGGPPITIVHLFDYPFEDDDQGAITEFFEYYGQVRKVRLEKYLRHEVYTGMRLVDVALRKTLPRIVSINAYPCRVWYKGQPIICNLCGAQGHKSGECPDKDKCHLCKQLGYKARECNNPWGNNPPGARPQDAGRAASVPADAQPAGDRPPPESQQQPEVNVIAEDNPPSTSGRDQADDAHDVSAESIPVGTAPDPVPAVFSSDVPLSRSQELQSSASISEFSSPEPSPSVVISDFSDDSQSILRDVPVCNDGSQEEASLSSTGFPTSEVVSQNSSSDSQNGDDVGEEEMDSSVSLKRDRSPSGESLSVDDSNSEPHPTDDESVLPKHMRPTKSGPLPSRKGVHSGLPVVLSDRPPPPPDE